MFGSRVRCSARPFQRNVCVADAERWPASLNCGGREGAQTKKDYIPAAIVSRSQPIRDVVPISGNEVAIFQVFKSTTMPSVSPVFALKPTIQSYDWGKRGSDSKVAQLASASSLSGFNLDESAPYAEVSINSARTTICINDIFVLAVDGDTPQFAISCTFLQRNPFRAP